MGYISKTYPAEIPCGIGAVDFMSIPKDIMRENMALSEWAILTGYRGSIAHGTYLGTKDIHATDDKDVMAISVPPRDYYIGLDRCGFGKKGTKEIFRGEWDIVCYEALKAIRLLIGQSKRIDDAMVAGECLHLQVASRRDSSVKPLHV